MALSSQCLFRCVSECIIQMLYWFSTTVSKYDPVTQQLQQKPVKPFLLLLVSSAESKCPADAALRMHSAQMITSKLRQV